MWRKKSYLYLTKFLISVPHSLSVRVFFICVGSVCNLCWLWRYQHVILQGKVENEMSSRAWNMLTLFKSYTYPFIKKQFFKFILNLNFLKAVISGLWQLHHANEMSCLLVTLFPCNIVLKNSHEMDHFPALTLDVVSVHCISLCFSCWQLSKW